MRLQHNNSSQQSCQKELLSKQLAILSFLTLRPIHTSTSKPQNIKSKTQDPLCQYANSMIFPKQKRSQTPHPLQQFSTYVPSFLDAQQLQQMQRYPVSLFCFSHRLLGRRSRVETTILPSLFANTNCGTTSSSNSVIGDKVSDTLAFLVPLNNQNIIDPHQYCQ